MPHGGVQFVDISLFVETAACGQGIALTRAMMAADLLSSGRLVPVFELKAKPAYAYDATCAPEALERAEVCDFMDWRAMRFAHHEQS